MSHPAIIVTPSTPTVHSYVHADLEKSAYAYTSNSSRYLTPPSMSDDMEHRLNVQRVQRRVQLVAAILALLLSAMAFASLVHPALYVKPASTAVQEHASGFLSSWRVGLGDHELRSVPHTPRAYQPVVRKIRRNEKRAEQLWKMPRVNLSPAVSEPEAPVEITVVISATETPEVDALPAQAVSSVELPKIRSIRAVQAQLMREAKARMLKRQEFVRKQAHAAMA